MKFCTICNTHIHQIHECSYNQQIQDRGPGFNQVQPQLNNMQKRKPLEGNALINQDRSRRPPNHEYYWREEPPKNNYYHKEERYSYRKGNRSGYYEERLRPRYERRRYTDFPRRGYINQERGGNIPECYYCHQNGHMKIDCQLWLKL
jgi:hypothetical protein